LLRGRPLVVSAQRASWPAHCLAALDGPDIPRHLTEFRESDLEMMMESAGFEVLRASISCAAR